MKYLTVFPLHSYTLLFIDKIIYLFIYVNVVALQEKFKLIANQHDNKCENTSSQQILNSGCRQLWEHSLGIGDTHGNWGRFGIIPSPNTKCGSIAKIELKV
jgi:hypothetical protein